MQIDAGAIVMTFEQWWQQYVKPAHFYTVEQTAKAAWDYQQKKIDELRAEIERMYKDRGLYTAWSNSDEG